jgi:protease I
MANLDGKRVAILVAEGFEQVEMTAPRKALQEAGAETLIVSPADAGEFDALLLPGGVANPDQLRGNAKAVEFTRAFVESGKPVAVICHGPWTLIEAGVVKGRRMTSWPTLKTDLRNAGANWVDEEVVVDRGLVSSRKPA